MGMVLRPAGLLLPAVLALPLLSGCATPQERAAQKQAEVEHMMTIYGPACSRLGYAAGSDPWRNCIVSLSTKDEMLRYGPGPGYYPGYYPGYWRGGYW